MLLNGLFNDLNDNLSTYIINTIPRGKYFARHRYRMRIFHEVFYLYLTQLIFTVIAIWHAAGDVVLVTALFLFALDLRHPFKTTIYTLTFVNGKALAIY